MAEKVKEIEKRKVSKKGNVHVSKSPLSNKVFHWRRLVQNIPETTNPQQVLSYIDNNVVNFFYFIALKEISKSSDEIISKWLDLNVKTYRNYIVHKADLGKQKQEQAVMLLSLFKHGANVFGTEDKFMEWLNKENFFFGKKKPISYFHTISGIQFVDDRLTAMEYGDNV